MVIWVVRCREAICRYFWEIRRLLGLYGWVLEFLELGAVFIIPLEAGRIIDCHYVERSRIQGFYFSNLRWFACGRSV